MLKRQRPSTPPPSLAETPSVPDFTYGDPSRLDRGAKRRRVVAPALDGRERGMQMNEEDWPDENDNVCDPAIDASESALSWEDRAGQYKHTNALLHQLHLEHRRRFQSFPPESSGPAIHSIFSVPSLPGQPTDHAYLKTPTQIPEELRFSIPAGSKETNVADEVNEVRARYEDNNRRVVDFYKTTNAKRKEQTLRFTRTTAKAGAEIKSRVTARTYCFTLSLFVPLTNVNVDCTVKITPLVHGFTDS